MSSDSVEIDLEEVSFYYHEMVRSDLVELELELPEGKIVLKRYQPSSNPLNLRRRRTDFLSEMSGDSHGSSAPQLPSQNYQEILSPITGVFYRSSSPQSAPFIKEGDIVASGATLCIVEAMKVMNEIKTDTGGKIIKILAENGKPVTKDQPLFHMGPS